MGDKIYWLIVAAIIIFGLIMPQEGKKKKHYILLMAGIHIFVCGWRYIYLTGDLRKYAWYYYTYNSTEIGWFDEDIFNGGRNAGFQWLCKAVSMLTNGDFHIFLIILAFFTQIVVALVIYKYSPRPWVSFLVWDCMSFYITYGFTSIKQGVAMSVLLLALMSVFEEKRKAFYMLVLLHNEKKL